MRCNYDASLICCRGQNDDYVPPNFGTSIATLNTPTSSFQAVASTPPAETITAPAETVTQRTTRTTVAAMSYSYYTTIYVYVTYNYYPTYTPTTTLTFTETTTLSAYVTALADADESFSERIDIIQSSISLEASLNTYTARTTSSSTAISGSGGGFAASAASLHMGIAGKIFLVVAVMIGVLAVLL